MSKRTSEWPTTYVSIFVCSRPQCAVSASWPASGGKGAPSAPIRGQRRRTSQSTPCCFMVNSRNCKKGKTRQQGEGVKWGCINVFFFSRSKIIRQAKASCFLNTSSHLYRRVRPSVRMLVRPSLGLLSISGKQRFELGKTL